MNQDNRWIRKWVVGSESGPGSYIVAQDKEGNWGCSCPAWKFRRKTCKHILEVMGGGGRTLAEAAIDRMQGR